VSIDSEQDAFGMRRVGKVVAHTLQVMRAAVHPGITTRELDHLAGQTLRAHGARSAPQVLYGFPGVACISVNDEAVHGVPGGRVIQAGDLVKLDVTAELNGYIADAAVTVVAAPAASLPTRLAGCAEAAFWQGCRVARAGARLNVIGQAVETEVVRWGFRVVAELGGHGVGRAIHEPPIVPNTFDPRDRTILTEGLVITIEPIISAGSPWVAEDADRWTLRTCDGGLSAHYEHTLVITPGQATVLTAA
jgi:methionyl aminopeptidase